MDEHKFPLGLAKQAVMKLDSAMTDISEMSQDEDLDPTQVEALDAMLEMISVAAASLVNMVSSEMGETEFLGEDIAMDDINDFPVEHNSEIQLDSNILDAAL